MTPEYYQANKAKYQAYHREYYKANKQKFRDKDAKWKAANPDKLRVKRKRNRNPIAEKLRREKRSAVYLSLKLKFGCMNPSCEWKGPYDPCLLDFHHVDAATKTGCVSQLRNLSVKRMLEEAAKCTLLCANCHRLVTYGELDDSMMPLCEIQVDETT